MALSPRIAPARPPADHRPPFHHAPSRSAARGRCRPDAPSELLPDALGRLVDGDGAWEPTPTPGTRLHGSRRPAPRPRSRGPRPAFTLGWWRRADGREMLRLQADNPHRGLDLVEVTLLVAVLAGSRPCSLVVADAPSADRSRGPAVAVSFGDLAPGEAVARDLALDFGAPDKPAPRAAGRLLYAVGTCRPALPGGPGASPGALLSFELVAD